MRITLNLATRPYRNYAPLYRRLHIAMGALAVVAVALGLGLRAVQDEAAQARAREAQIDAKIAALNREHASFQRLMALPENKLALAQVATLNKLFDEKAFSWTLAMEDLEMVLPAGVQVASIEPMRDKEGKITLHMRVLGARDRAVQFVVNLERSRRFRAPRIVGESAESGNHPGQPLAPVSSSGRVSFDLLADYNPPSPGEALAIRANQKADGAASPAQPGLKSARATTAGGRR